MLSDFDDEKRLCKSLLWNFQRVKLSSPEGTQNMRIIETFTARYDEHMWRVTGGDQLMRSPARTRPSSTSESVGEGGGAGGAGSWACWWWHSVTVMSGSGRRMSRADGARAAGGGVGANGAALAATLPPGARTTRPPLTTLTTPVSVPVSRYHNPYCPGTGICIYACRVTVVANVTKTSSIVDVYIRW